MNRRSPKIASELRTKVGADFDDPAPQLEYADYLEENGDALFAEYVRLHVTLASKPKRKLPKKLSDRRRILLHECPSAYEWDNFLALREFDRNKSQYTSMLKQLTEASDMPCEAFRCATQRELNSAERELGFRLPPVYREFLAQISNGIRFRSPDGQWEYDLFGTRSLVANVGTKFRRDTLRANRKTLRYGDPTGETPLGMNQLSTALDYEANEFRKLDGMLLIGENLEGACVPMESKLFMVVAPPLSGLLIYCNAFESPVVNSWDETNEVPHNLAASLLETMHHIQSWVEEARQDQQ